MPALISPRNRLILPRSYSKPLYPFIDRTHQLCRGLVGCWVMGEQLSGVSTGMAFADIAASHHAITQLNGSGAAFTLNAGHHGGTAPGTNDAKHYFETGIGIDKLWGTASGTICGWYKPAQTFNNGSAETMLDTNSSQLAFKFTDNNIYFGFDVGGAGRVHFAATAANWPAGSWAFYAFTWVNGGTTTAYVNGVNSGTNAGTSQGASSNLRFHYNYGSPGVNSGSGTPAIDMIRVYNRALSDQEILRLYAEPYAGIFSFSRYLVGVSATTAALLARSSFAAFGRAGGSFAASVTASSSAQAKARGAMSAAAALAAKAEAQSTARGGMSASAALAARGTAITEGRTGAGYTAALKASAAAQAKSRGAMSATAALSARLASALQTRSGLGAVVALSARSVVAVAAKAGASYSAALAARSALAVTARVPILARVTIAARSAFAVFGRLFQRSAIAIDPEFLLFATPVAVTFNARPVRTVFAAQPMNVVLM